MKSVASLRTVGSSVKSLAESALEQSGGLLRLAPCWVPRTFVQPGHRLKLHPDAMYGYGLNRGGIDERWFASTTPAANENRAPDEGLSYRVFEDNRFTLTDAVRECGAEVVGESIWDHQGSGKAQAVRAQVQSQAKVKSGPTASDLPGRRCAAFSLVICSPITSATAALLTLTPAQALMP